MIGAAHQIAVGLRVGLDADAHGCGDGAGGVAQRGIVHREHGEQASGEKRAQLVQINIGDDALLGTVGWATK